MPKHSGVRNAFCPIVILLIITSAACADDSALPPLRASGTVVDDRTGKPVPEFDVTFGDDASVPYWQPSQAHRFTGGRFEGYEPQVFPRKAYRVQVRAKGYKGAASRVIAADEHDAKLEFRLVPIERFAGSVRRPDGKPAAGATVAVVTPGDYLVVTNGGLSIEEPAPPGGGWRVTKTGADGKFEVDVDCERCRLVALDAAGFAEFPATPATREATLKPWGSIACTVELDGRSAAGLVVTAEPHDEADRRADDDPYVQFRGSAITGLNGQSVLPYVPPGRTVVAIREERNWGGRDRHFGTLSVRETPVEVPADGCATVRLGGGGAEVTGRFTAAGRSVPWGTALARLYPVVPPKTELDWRGEAMRRHGIPVDVRPDGSFRATDVPPGEWQFDSKVFLPATGGFTAFRAAGEVKKQFHVGEQQALDLGDLPATFRTVLNPGDPAPDFEVTTFDGKPLRLADLRGKFVVLDFWATWCGPCRRDMPELKKSWEAMKADPDVVVLGLSVDKTDEPVRPFVAEHGYGWTHAVLGEGSKISKAYGVEYIPHLWLVLPDGKLANAEVVGLREQIQRHRQKIAGAAR